MRTNRSGRVWASVLLAGCFSDPGTFDDDDADATGSATDAGTTAVSASASGGPSGSASGSASTVTTSDESGSTTAPPGSSTTGSDESGSGSSDTGEAGFCDAQPEEVVICYDFDGASPFAGASVWEQHGTVDASDAQSVSPPRSMEVVALGDAAENTNASIGRGLPGVPVPFAGELALQAFVEDACFTFMSGGPERLLGALNFIDENSGAGPFLLNFTLWVTSTESTLYVSTEGQGFPSQPYPLGIPFPTEQWVPIAIAFDATSDVATVTIGATTQEVTVGVITDDVTQEIAGIAPAISVGTAMGPGVPGCTMWFDDVVVTSE
jgi:hypothetical protein